MLENLEVQLKRTKGYRMPTNCIKVARPTIWGNPFQTANEYRLWLTTDWEPIYPGGGHSFDGWKKFTRYKNGARWDYEKLRAQKQIILSRIKSLRNKQLACFCPIGCDCHRQVLIELANR